MNRIDSQLEAELLRSGIGPAVRGKLDLARRRGLGLVDALLETGDVPRLDLLAALGRVHDAPSVDLEKTHGDPLVLGLLPKDQALALEALPLYLAGNTLSIALADPENLEKIDRLAFITGRTIQPVVALSTQLRAKLIEAYGAPELDLLESLEFESPDEEEGSADRNLETDPDDRPIVRLVNLILVRALGARATDIHLEPDGKELLVRFRVDGILERLPHRLPTNLAPAVVSRLKVLARLDISVRRRPQDGKLTLRLRDRRVDVRISTLPTIHGEKVVLRLLDKERDDFTLDSIGMQEAMREQWAGLLARREGLLIVTGPTGSGKTSTLYASLQHLRSPEINIVTIEDPVEYEVPGLAQIQVNEASGLTFAAGLRSILRQDPDVILVGEIRDGETARIAVQAALTGHLVLASMHTIDAPSAVARLVDLGVPPFLVAATLLGVVGQRLVRRSCASCSREVDLAEDERRDWKPWLERLAGAVAVTAPERERPATCCHPAAPASPVSGDRLLEPAGCSSCSGSGYHGRTGVFELLVLRPELRDLIANGAGHRTLRSVAESGSYAPMWLDGLEKVSVGTTSLRELSRHVQPPEPMSGGVVELRSRRAGA